VFHDLHDGLGPQLASLTLTLAAARELLRHDVDAADTLLQELSAHTQAAIAERLVLSPKTIRNYITEIFSKLQVADRAQAIIRARNAGLG
jgi:ParB-like chromosome segregation protein Spo0J